jgi:hypothetical protein
MLDGVIGVLRWKGCEQEALDLAESAYTSMLAERLGGCLGDLEEVEPDLATHILRLLSSADSVTLRRVLLAPETTCRLLWGHPGACDDRSFWQFLSDAFEIEFTLCPPAPVPGQAGLPSTSSSTRWSALGNVRFNVAEGIVAQVPLGGLVVDADSPAAVCFDGTNDICILLKHYGDPMAKKTALSKTREAMLALDAMDQTIANFVRRFTLVANIVTDQSESGFSSGSTDQYIGRSIFWNAHLPGISLEVLAEALVHEAIHSLLYMHEVREPWFISTDEYPCDAFVESPWTGARLRLEPFLQACFVWFGLCNLWSSALGKSTFVAQRVHERLNTARRGFLIGPLLSRLAEHVPLIAPEFCEQILLMQEEIVFKKGTGEDVL